MLVAFGERMVAQAPLIADVVQNPAPHGKTAANRSAFVSSVDRFADMRANSFYTGNAASSTVRPFLMPHKVKLRAEVGPSSYFPRDTQQRPRTTSPDFTKPVGRGECFDRTEDQKTTEFIFRDSNWTIDKEAQLWRRGGARFSRSSQRPKPKKKAKNTGSVYNPDRGGQGGSKYQSLASCVALGGSPQRYSAAFRSTGRDGSSRKLETSKQRRERECREKLGPGTYSAPSADQLLGSVRRAQTAAARYSPVFVPTGRAAHDTTPPSSALFTPGPGHYDGATVWKQKIAPRAARGEVRLALASAGAGADFRGGPAVGAGQPAPTVDARMRVPLSGEGGTWSLEKDARRWRRTAGSPVGAFSGEQRLTLDTQLSYSETIKPNMSSG